MKLKEKLQDYTQAEFMELVERIWLCVGPEQQALVEHFISIVDVPEREALLFDPPQAMTFGNRPTSAAVAAYVKLRHNKSGKPAFSDDTLPASVPGVRPSPEQAAVQQSILKQATARLLLTGIQSAGRTSHEALERFAVLIAQFANGEFSNVQLASFLEAATALEIAQEAVHKAIYKYEFFEPRLEMSWSAAQRDISGPRLATPLHNEIFDELNRGRDDYRLQLPTLRQRHLELHGYSVAVFSAAEKQLARLRLIEGRPLARTFQASLVNALQYPNLLLPELPTDSLATRFNATQSSVRSAIAALTQQVPGADGAAVGAYAGILSFYFVNFTDEHDFGVCMPLAEVTHLEGTDWHAVAAALGEVELPLRLCCGASPFTQGTLRRGLREVTSLIEVRLTSARTGAGVRVRSALRDEDGQGFSFADGDVSISWRAGAISAEPVVSGKPAKIGFFNSPQMPQLEFFETLQDIRFNDYVVVFPAGSGHPPLYVMLRDHGDSLPGSPLPAA